MPEVRLPACPPTSLPGVSLRTTHRAACCNSVWLDYILVTSLFVSAVPVALRRCCQGAPLPPGQHLRLNPADKRVPFVYIPRTAVDSAIVANPSVCEGKAFVADITSWEAQGRFPRGNIRSCLGDLTAAATQRAMVLEVQWAMGCGSWAVRAVDRL